MNSIKAPFDLLEVRRELDHRAVIADMDENMRAGLRLITGNKHVMTAGLIGCALYDVARPNGGDALVRSDIGADAGLLISLQDKVDGHVDEDMAGRSLADRFDYLNQMAQMLMYGQTVERPANYPRKLRLGDWMAQDFYKRISSQDQTGLFISEAEELNNAVKEQFVCNDSERMMVLSQEIWARCLGMIGAIIIHKDGQRPDDVMAAAHALGAYGGILDHLYEINDDLVEGSLTYATLRIWEEGDSRALRREIKHRMLGAANDRLHSVLPDLNRRQRKSVMIIARMLSLKFRLKGLSGHHKMVPSSIALRPTLD